MKKFGILIVFALLFESAFAADAISSKKSQRVDLGKIVVSPSRLEQLYSDIPNNISIISADDLGSIPEEEFTEVLNLLPSVDIIDYGSTGSTRAVHTRGASTQNVLTLIDGRPANTPRDGMTDYNQISLSNIEQVEVLRGPASSIYGSNAVGGVINITTKRGKEKMHTELTSKAGSFSTNFDSFSHGWKIKNFDYFVSYDYLSSHGHREGANYRSQNVNSKIGYEIAKGNHLSFSSGFFRSKVGSPGPVVFQDLDDRTDTYKNFFDFTYNGKILDKTDIFVKFYHNRDRLEFLETLDPLQKDAHLTKDYGFNSQVSFKIFEFLRSTFGLDYTEHRLDSTTSAKHNYNVNAAYFEDELDLFDMLNIKIGARWDNYSNFGDRISPSGSMSFWIFDKIKIHGIAAKSFRAPTFNDLYWPRRDYGWGYGEEGNPNLGPEKAFSFEGGLATYFLDTLKTDVTFFKTRYSNLIEWASANGTWWTVENLGSALVEGIEAEIDYAPIDKFKINYNYTYLQTDDLITHNELIYRPKHLIKLRLNYQPVSFLEIGANCLYKTKVFTNKPNTDKLAPYFVMNLDFIYTVNKYAKVLFEAKNIFDRNYQEEKDYSVPGRAFYGGVKLSF